ncbi:MAG TPA: hypothetical protein ENK87_03265, partial [Nitratifractor sp.]|nr:hypothetical protein [Nitratifractor sp.]
MVAVINTIASPLEVAVYRDGILFKRVTLDGLASDELLPLLLELLKEGVSSFLYTSGPGSHMATKICYTLLKSVEVLKGVPFYAVSGFDLNGNEPIKALGKLYFIKEKENIITKKFQEAVESSFVMPVRLEHLKVLECNEPDY